MWRAVCSACMYAKHGRERKNCLGVRVTQWTRENRYTEIACMQDRERRYWERGWVTLSAVGSSETQYTQNKFNESFLLRHLGTLTHLQVAVFLPQHSLQLLPLFFRLAVWVFFYFMQYNVIGSSSCVQQEHYVCHVYIHFLNSRSYCRTHTPTYMRLYWKTDTNSSKTYRLFYTCAWCTAQHFSPFFSLSNVCLSHFNSYDCMGLFIALIFQYWNDPKHVWCAVELKQHIAHTHIAEYPIHSRTRAQLAEIAL